MISNIFVTILIIIISIISLLFFYYLGKYNKLLLNKRKVEFSFLELDKLFTKKINLITKHKLNDELAISFAKIKRDYAKNENINEKIGYAYQINLITEKLDDPKIKAINEKVEYAATFYNKEVRDYNMAISLFKIKKLPTFSEYKIEI